MNSKFGGKESIFNLLTPGPHLLYEAGTIGILLAPFCSQRGKIICQYHMQQFGKLTTGFPRK